MFTRLIPVQTQYQCWSQATQQKSQGTPKPAISTRSQQAFVVGEGPRVIRVGPAEFISLKQTKICPRAVHRNGRAGV